MQGDPDRPATRSPKDFWEGSFGRYTGQVKESEGDKEKKDSLRDQQRSSATLTSLYLEETFARFCLPCPLSITKSQRCNFCE
jgi:hypothetical protein